jgi:hypothetical protein
LPAAPLLLVLVAAAHRANKQSAAIATLAAAYFTTPAEFVDLECKTSGRAQPWRSASSPLSCFRHHFHDLISFIASGLPSFCRALIRSESGCKMVHEDLSTR